MPNKTKPCVVCNKPVRSDCLLKHMRMHAKDDERANDQKIDGRWHRPCSCGKLLRMDVWRLHQKQHLREAEQSEREQAEEPSEAEEVCSEIVDDVVEQVLMQSGHYEEVAAHLAEDIEEAAEKDRQAKKAAKAMAKWIAAGDELKAMEEQRKIMALMEPCGNDSKRGYDVCFRKHKHDVEYIKRKKLEKAWFDSFN